MNKKFSEIANQWIAMRALPYLGNFIRNHKASINDNDIFEPITDLAHDRNWPDFIREKFPKMTIRRLENVKDRRERLDFTDSPQEILREIWNADFARTRLKKLLLEEIDRLQTKYPAETYADETFPKKFAELRRTFALSELESDVLLVLALVGKGVLTVIDNHSRHSDENDKAVFVAKCLDCDLAAVLGALDANGKLRRYGCVDDDFDFNERLSQFLTGVSPEPLCSSFYSLCRDEVLPWGFYGQLGEKHGETVKRIIRADGAANILFYGEPGTGKTSFAKTIAAQLGRKCYCIAQDTRGGFRDNRVTCSPEFRFAALQVCDAQVDPENSLIVVDESDDMLSDGNGGPMGFFAVASRKSGDKGMLNAVLDKLRTPTIWISNTPAEFLNASSRRRFDYSIRFEPLSAAQRCAIWRNNVEKLDLSGLISPELAESFACRYAVSAGIITKVLTNVRRLTPAPEAVRETMEKLMTQHCELLQISATDEKLLPAKDYSLEGLNISGDIPLDRIVAAVRKFQQEPADSAPDRPRMNLLLSGPPGTGKTEFVKYLGQALQTPVTVRMGSDLLGMYVGETEANIRRAFAEAEAAKSILFFDEIDGMVQRRERARHSWEVSQVSELLHRMENFDGVMIGATNFADNLDPAIMRRFTFKIDFDYLNDAGKKLFFERMFQTELTPEELARLKKIGKLSPGDFRTVRQSLYYLEEHSNALRLDGLERESRRRSGSGKEEADRIGFSGN